MRKIVSLGAVAAVMFATAHAVERSTQPADLDLGTEWSVFRYSSARVSGTLEYWRGLLALESGRTDDALEAFEAAAGRFNPDAKLRLARMYRDGNGVPVDHEEAILWYLPLAADGHSLAQYELAQMLEAGARETKGREAALYWYRQAAEGGDPSAQRRLATAEHDKEVAQVD